MPWRVKRDDAHAPESMDDRARASVRAAAAAADAGPDAAAAADVGPDAAGVEPDAAQTCAICLDSTDLVRLPCCERESAADSSTRFCLECLGLHCDHSGGVGRCPRCARAVSSVVVGIS